MTEISETLDKKLNLKSPSKREEYLTLLDRLIESAFTKTQNKYCKNNERIQWTRVIALLVKAGSSILKDQDLDELTERVNRLERGERSE